MHIKKIIFILLFFCFLSNPSLIGQKPAKEEIPILFRSEKTWGILAHTQGLGINYRIGQYTTAASKYLLHIEGVSMKHPKEIKTVNPYFEDAKSFKFGKLNSAAILRLGLEKQKTLNFKPLMGGVEVRYLYTIGINTAILKPIYLSILYPTDIPYKYIPIDEKFDPDKHNSDLIYGRASFFKGFNGLRFYPGAFLKFGFGFDYGAQNDLVRALDLGIIIDGYLQRVPIMAFETNNNYFITLYVSLHFGKRAYY